VVVQVPARMRTTTRLRVALAVAVEDGRDQAEVAAAHAVSWPTVQRAVVAHGALELAEPEPTTVLGMDETRFGRPRWLPDGVRADGRVRWVRTDPWETGFVDIAGDQGLLGQVDGRTSAAVKAWLQARNQAFRDELTTLAQTIEAWRPAVEVFLTTGLTNARTEGTNRLIKQVKRAACGFRNRDYRRRVRLHCTRRTRRLSARKPTVPAQS
jgi:transposase